eukprot:6473216-Pyramimonas_sp.AAC.1
MDILRNFERLCEASGAALKMDEKPTAKKIQQELIDRDQKNLARRVAACNKGRAAVAHPDISLVKQVVSPLGQPCGAGEEALQAPTAVVGDTHLPLEA